MQPRLRIRILSSRLRGGRLRRWSRPAKRFDVPHQLPALRFRQLRPDRHPLSNDTIRQYPENRARRGALNFGGTQARPLATLRPNTITFGAALFQDNPPASNAFRAVLKSISPLPPL